MAQQELNMVWKLQEGQLRARFLLHVRDAKSIAALDQVSRAEGVQVLQTPYRTPVANSFVERWVGTVKARGA
jgi:putative transposase